MSKLATNKAALAYKFLDAASRALLLNLLIVDRLKSSVYGSVSRVASILVESSGNNLQPSLWLNSAILVNESNLNE